MKQILPCIILVAFTSVECEAINGKQLPSPPPAPEKKNAKPHSALKYKKKRISRQEIERLRKQSEKEGKRQGIEARRREYQQMQKAREQGMKQMQEEILKQQRTKDHQ
ncbi:hypothetical protein KI809_01155 [Geobacter pelophilus]|uniref:Uncharacterized protein n=1 Tax=Geoanaerobacter pelophilus TaxID=60036 RepID=A0AAW4L6L4_9BACT|nr:hypothetical protein [Geoanaerobacter pelophilus]MBT0662891.1 hypothetical protein [Geoanaerobacter pelophilus]